MGFLPRWLLELRGLLPTADNKILGRDTGVWAFYDRGEPPLGNPEEDGQILASSTAGVRSWVTLNTARKRLTEDIIYHVSITGSDSNDGLTIDTPFLTIQKAFNTVAGLDLDTYNAIIQLADGTYTEAYLNLTGCIGNPDWLTTKGMVVLQGNATTPANTIISGITGNSCLKASQGAKLIVKNFKVQTGDANPSSHLSAQINAFIGIQNIIFGTMTNTSGGNLHAESGGIITTQADYSIIAGASYHAKATTSGTIWDGLVTTTLTGTPNFTDAYFIAEGGGTIIPYGATFSGSATGKKFRISKGGSLLNMPSLSYPPGDIAGTDATTFDWLSDLASTEISITETTTATIGKMHVCSGTTADYTVTLPPVAGNTGKMIGFRMSSGLTKLVTIDGNASELIDGALTRVMWANEVAILLCDGSVWTKIYGKSIPMHGTMNPTANNLFAAATITQIVLANTSVAEGVICATSGSGSITVKRPGKYKIYSQLVWNNTNASTANVLQTRVYKNGSPLFNTYIPTVANQYITSSAVSDVNLVAGDIITIYAWFADGSYTTTAVNGNTGSYVSVLEIPTW